MEALHQELAPTTIDAASAAVARIRLFSNGGPILVENEHADAVEDDLHALEIAFTRTPLGVSHTEFTVRGRRGRWGSRS